MAFEAGDFAPRFIVKIEGQQINEDVVRFIDSVEFESADSVMDEVRLNIKNPKPAYKRDAAFLWTDRNVFYPGNEIDLFMGYKAPLTHMARVRLAEPSFSFPQDGQPTISIRGFSPDRQMSASSPAAHRFRLGEENKIRRKQKNPGLNLSQDIAEIVQKKANSYGFYSDIDPVKIKLPPQSFQRVGMTDLNLIRALSNISGHIFWVDHFTSVGEFSESPVLHFRDPDKIGFNAGMGLQEKIYTFKYAQGDLSTCLSFDPEYSISGIANKMIVAMTLKDGTIYEQEISFNVEDKDTISSKFRGDIAEDKIAKNLENADQILLIQNDFAISLLPASNLFHDAATLEQWLYEFFRDQRKHFITANVKTIGIENLRARQVHKFSGLGLTFDGEYYVPRVRHIMTAGGGYTCDLNVRKIIGNPIITVGGVITDDEVTDDAIEAAKD